MPTRRGLALWSSYMRPVEAFVAADEVRAVHVHYEDLLADWRREVQRIADSLDVALEVPANASAVDAFLETAMRNHRATDAELQSELDGPEGDAVWQLYRRTLDRCERSFAG